MPDGFPKVLYKFRHFDDEGYHLKILTDNKIFLASPLSFNDPFDCRIPIRYDLCTEPQIVEYLTKVAKLAIPDIIEDDARREAERLCKTIDFSDRERVNTFFKQYYTNNLGVFSLASDYSNLLLWSHYSDSHKGFCVGFDTRVIAFIQDYIDVMTLCESIYQALYKEWIVKMIVFNRLNSYIIYSLTI